MIDYKSAFTLFFSQVRQGYENIPVVDYTFFKSTTIKKYMTVLLANIFAVELSCTKISHAFI